ncbi:hypothetical protein CGLO_14496 [Colletotrichum gloeosporioides Cg-14]|uniref:Uncharacterized protein n=1 Tax=Colletotrichum gloeosporioides (strain Cg-14) TaxID=1237896 RepID=T0K3W5_COLGC|nr:hypothetical protein CGLO_14496 [Colletotrichum gloeosporioides Cg-14]
MHNIIAKETLS